MKTEKKPAIREVGENEQKEMSNLFPSNLQETVENIRDWAQGGLNGSPIERSALVLLTSDINEKKESSCLQGITCGSIKNLSQMLASWILNEPDHLKTILKAIDLASNADPRVALMVKINNTLSMMADINEQKTAGGALGNILEALSGLSEEEEKVVAVPDKR